MRALPKWVILLLLITGLSGVAVVHAADDNTATEAAVLSQAELDQMLAPIALYPDALLAQILMASTYPLEVVEAARWSEEHPDLAGGEAVEAVEDKDWEPSVQALVAFPEVLARMSDNLRWTGRLGEAFLSQEKEVMATVQSLREKADAAGNLDDLEHVRVQRSDRVIIIEPATTEVVYVPYYNPTVIYGSWWWPAYPPVYWSPRPGYYLSTGFYWGHGIRISSSFFFFSGFDWHRHHIVVINPRRHSHKTYLRTGRHPVTYYRDPYRHGYKPWRHHREHRHGVRYNRYDIHRERRHREVFSDKRHSGYGPYSKPRVVKQKTLQRDHHIDRKHKWHDSHHIKQRHRDNHWERRHRSSDFGRREFTVQQKDHRRDSFQHRNRTEHHRSGRSERRHDIHFRRSHRDGMEFRRGMQQRSFQHRGSRHDGFRGHRQNMRGEHRGNRH